MTHTYLKYTGQFLCTIHDLRKLKMLVIFSEPRHLNHTANSKIADQRVHRLRQVVAAKIL